jgi:hypothetical protein
MENIPTSILTNLAKLGGELAQRLVKRVPSTWNSP